MYEDVEELLSEAEVCKILSVSRSYISTSRDKLKIPYYRIGSLVKYKKSEVLLWLKTRKVS